MKKPFIRRHKGAEPVVYNRHHGRCNRGRMAGLLQNQRGDITIYTCFFIAGTVMLVSFLLLYASIRITCINIRNGAKMELNNLSASIYQRAGEGRL